MSKKKPRHSLTDLVSQFSSLSNLEPQAASCHQTKNKGQEDSSNPGRRKPAGEAEEASSLKNQNHA
jgi:hypothetical protein